jgi:Ca2+-binding RTX toxin-like protein
LWGAAFVGSLELEGGDVAIAGDFGPDGQDPASVTDSNAGELGPSGTLTIAYWGSLSLDNLQLYTTELNVNGLLLTQDASVATVAIEGTNAVWLAGDATVTAGISITNSATVEGSLVLESGVVLSIDPSSSLEDGSVAVEGSVSLNLLPEPTVMSPPSAGFMDNLALEAGSTLTVASGGNAAYLVYDAAVSGPGTLALAATDVDFLPQATLGSVIEVEAGTATVATSSIEASATFVLSSAVLDFRPQVSQTSGLIVDVDCIGGMNTIYSGSSPLDILDSSSASSTLITSNGSTFAMASEQVSIQSENTSCSVTVTADDLATPSDEVNAERDYPVGQITVSGAGSSTITVGDINETIYGQKSTGDNEYFGGTGAGLTEIYDGSGNDTVIGGSGALDVNGGSGSLLVWGGTSGDDTITGGTGLDTLVGGQGATVIGIGDEPDVLGDYASDALVDDSQTNGADTIFGGVGDGVTTVLGGHGNDVIVGNSATLDVICGSGNTSVWTENAANDTIIGGDGNDLLQGGLNSLITLSGSGQDTVLAQSGMSNINAADFGGSCLFFCGGSGASTINGGSGALTVVGAGGSLDVTLGLGNAEIWAAQDRYDTILGGSGNDTLIGGYGDILQSNGSGTNDLISQSSDVTLSSANAGGSTTFFLSGGANNAVIAGGGENVIVASSGSAQISINGGSDQLWLGSGPATVDLLNSSLIGSLLVFGYNPLLDSIELPTSPSSISISENCTSLTSENETIVLWGFDGQPVIHG